MWKYTEKVMDHFLNPRNVGEIEDADAVAEVGNITCGDALKIYLKLDAEGKIAEAKFKTFGCASAIASSSALTELVKGKTLEEAAKITNKDIVALQAAISDYKKRHGESYEAVESDDDHEGRIVCKCFGVTDTKIRKVALENNLHTVAQITDYTKAGGACGRCLDEIQEILDGIWREQSGAKSAFTENSSKADEFAKLTVVQKVIKVNEVIEKEIRPALERDGGSVELADIEGNVVKVRLKGRCAACHNAGLTLKKLVEGKLREFVSENLTVEEA